MKATRLLIFLNQQHFFYSLLLSVVWLKNVLSFLQKLRVDCINGAQLLP